MIIFACDKTYIIIQSIERCKDESVHPDWIHIWMQKKEGKGRAYYYILYIHNFDMYTIYTV